MKPALLLPALLFSLSLSPIGAGAHAQDGAASAPASVPALVLRIARAAQALPEAAAARARGDAVQEFAHWFFEGFTHPDGGNSLQDAYTRTAWEAGQAFWRERLGRRDEIMAGYGYARVEAQGSWRRRFEVSAFTPEDRPGETWWVSSFGGVRWTALQPGQADADFAAARVRLSGYLSPPGRHGHLGQYGRTLLATAFTVVAAP